MAKVENMRKDTKGVYGNRYLIKTFGYPEQDRHRGRLCHSLSETFCQTISQTILYTEKKYIKSNNILAATAINVLLSGLYRYGVAVTTILV